MIDKEQTEYLIKAEETLGLSPTRMGPAVLKIPYDSYKDLRNGRRKLRDLHRLVIDMTIAIVSDKKRPLEKERKRIEQAIAEAA